METVKVFQPPTGGDLLDCRSVMGRRIIACVAALALSIGIALGTLSAQAATGCTPQSSWGTLDGGLAAQIVTLVKGQP